MGGVQLNIDAGLQRVWPGRTWTCGTLGNGIQNGRANAFSNVFKQLCSKQTRECAIVHVLYELRSPAV